MIQSDERLINRYAELRTWAAGAGHPLAQKVHEADRWVASTALAAHLELIAGDRIFNGVTGLSLLDANP